MAESARECGCADFTDGDWVHDNRTDKTGGVMDKIDVALVCSACGEHLHYKSNRPVAAVICPYCGEAIDIKGGTPITEIIEHG